MRFEAAAVSDIGLSRSSNQDSAYISNNFLLVADGMGGYAGGDLASKIVVDFLSDVDFLSVKSREELKETIIDSLESAKNTFGKLIGANPNLNMMGSTITFLALAGNDLLLGHVGDSRAYKFSGQKLVQLSQDHTVVQQLVDSGKLTLKKSKKSHSRHQLTRVFGFFDIKTNPDIEFLPVKSGDRYILCSDGLSAFVSDKVIAKALSNFPDNTQASEKLVELAMRNGSTDNITVIIATVLDNKDEVLLNQKFGSAAKQPQKHKQVQNNGQIQSSDQTQNLDKTFQLAKSKNPNQNNSDDEVSLKNDLKSKKAKVQPKPFWNIFG
ncbi:MAG: serine/threonine-protein phosphatase [Bifidobacteriaceae bacterium]|jgi:protein phosphatase|nr:serine/threonine-protein phosphatase [Bifidobacteriaceae bacterium]